MRANRIFWYLVDNMIIDVTYAYYHCIFNEWATLTSVPRILFIELLTSEFIISVFTNSKVK